MHKGAGGIILTPFLQDMKKDDLYFDEPLLRRIERAAQAESAHAEPSSDREEEAEEDEDVTMNNTIKEERDVMTDDDD